MSRFDHFVAHDHHARDRAHWVSFLICLTSAIFFRLVLGIKEHALGYTMFAVYAVVFIYQVVRYCSARHPLPQESPARFEIGRRFAMAAIASMIMILLAAFPAQTVQAALIDRRLRKLASGQPLSPENAEKVATDLQFVVREHLQLPPETLIETRKSVEVSVAQPGTTSAIASAGEALTSIDEGEKIDEREEAALKAYRDGSEHLMKATLTYGFGIATDRDTTFVASPDAILAAKHFSSASDLSRDQTLLRKALLGRAGAYTMIGEFTKALEDTEEAKRLGALNLRRIFDIEAQAFVQRGASEADFKVARELFTILLAMEPAPFELKFKGLPTTMRIYRLTWRSFANYQLLEFTAAIRDAKAALALKPFPPGQVKEIYGLLIFSQLRAGATADAIESADTLRRMLPGPEVHVLNEILRANRDDPKRAIQEILRSSAAGFSPKRGSA